MIITKKEVEQILKDINIFGAWVEEHKVDVKDVFIDGNKIYCRGCSSIMYPDPRALVYVCRKCQVCITKYSIESS